MKNIRSAYVSSPAVSTPRRLLAVGPGAADSPELLRQHVFTSTHSHLPELQYSVSFLIATRLSSLQVAGGSANTEPATNSSWPLFLDEYLPRRNPPAERN